MRIHEDSTLSHGDILNRSSREKCGSNNMNPLGRRIVCAYKNYEYLKARYPKRMICPDAFAVDDRFYYSSPEGRIRIFEITTNTIWECDWEAGPPVVRRIRRHS